MSVLDHPVEAGQHGAGAAGSGTVEHPDPDQLHPFGHPVRGPTHGACDVSAVPIAVCSQPTERVISIYRAAAKLRVAVPDAGIDDVGGDPLASLGVSVVAVQRDVMLVNAVQPPGGIGLNLGRLHHLVSLDAVHVRVAP